MLLEEGKKAPAGSTCTIWGGIVPCPGLGHAQPCFRGCCGGAKGTKRPSEPIGKTTRKHTERVPARTKLWVWAAGLSLLCFPDGKLRRFALVRLPRCLTSPVNEGNVCPGEGLGAIVTARGLEGVRAQFRVRRLLFLLVELCSVVRKQREGGGQDIWRPIGALDHQKHQEKHTEKVLPYQLMVSPSAFSPTKSGCARATRCKCPPRGRESPHHDLLMIEIMMPRCPSLHPKHPHHGLGPGFLPQNMPWVQVPATCCSGVSEPGTARPEHLHDPAF